MGEAGPRVDWGPRPAASPCVGAEAASENTKSAQGFFPDFPKVAQDLKLCHTPKARFSHFGLAIRPRIRENVNGFIGAVLGRPERIDDSTHAVVEPPRDRITLPRPSRVRRSRV